MGYPSGRVTTMILGLVQAITEKLQAAGIAAKVDPRNLKPPCAWVSPVNLVEDTLCWDTPSVELDIILIAPDYGAERAMAALDKMLEPAMRELAKNGANIQSVKLDGSATLSGAGSLPAYIINITATAP